MMNQNLRMFTQKRQLLEQSITLDWNDEGIERKFNFVSAELLHFLPDIPFSNHQNIFKNILLNTKVNKLELEFPSVLENVSFHNFSIETENFITKNPCIFCAWHFGAYKLINHFIAKKNIPYSLVISKNILQSKGNSFIEDFNSRYGDNHNKTLTIIDAESPLAGLKILRNIKEGKSILFYLDGNTGTGSTRDNTNNCYINFLKGKIFARKGVAFLSHLSRIPILPIVTYRKGINKIVFHFGELVFPDIAKDRNEYAIDCTQKLYDIIAGWIKIYPDQWEAWLYLYKVMKSNNTRLEQIDFDPHLYHTSLRFNTLLFGIYKFEESYYLFNKKHFISFNINCDIYTFLKNSIKNAANVNRLDENLLRQLCRNEVIIPAN